MKRVLLAVLCLVLAAGCATIPQESQPSVVPGERPGQGAAGDVPDPAQGIDPLTLVRAFIRAAAQPGGADSTAAARAYLDDQSRVKWKPSRELTVVQDTFSTVPDSTAPSTDPNTVDVIARGTDVGTLGADGSFTPNYSEFRQHFTVRKQQSNGQWRIVDPPFQLRVTETDLSTNYSPVSANFYSPDSGTFVPDLRYVPAKPQSGLPSRVLYLLFGGPSASLDGSVKNLLTDPVQMDANVKSLDDGTLVIPLTGLSGASDETRTLIAAQIVLSLQNVTSTRIRILADGAPLVANHPDWRASDLPAYGAAVSPSLDLPGLMTTSDHRVRSLADGQPVPGPAGNGGYDVVRAAQSPDGRRLAVVDRFGGQDHLRIGDLGRDLPQVPLNGGTLSRPTWRPGGGELWTVVDQQTVARMVLTPNGQWSALTVNSAELPTTAGISEMRFSRDGARVAAVVGGQLVVAAVVRTPDSVVLRAPRILQPHDLTSVVDVDWLTQDTLVAVTKSTSQPVVRVTVDGRRMDAYNSSNLTPPVSAVTAAPSRSIIVADGGGLWTASELGEVWRPQAHTFPGADPFYPG